MDTKKRLVISICIYLFALILRLWGLGQTGIYPDEITWMVKGKESVYALGKMNMNYFRQAWWNDKKEGFAIGWPVVILSGLSHVLFAGEGKYSLHIFSDIVASRIPIVFLHALLPALIFWYGSLWTKKWKVSVAAAIGYALNPVVIGLDRWVIHDSSLTLFSFWAIADFLEASRQKKLSWAPGIILGLAFLCKPNGLLIVLPWLVSTFMTKNWKLLIVNFVSAAALVTLIWPQSWIEPIWSAIRYTLAQTSFAQVPQMYFYFGQQTHFLPWHYYLFQLVTRTPEAVLLGALAGFVLLCTRTKKESYSGIFWPVLIYIVTFLLIVAVSLLKNGVRYALPIYPWIYLTAFWGFAQLPHSKWWIAAALALLLVPLRYYPNYYLYYNSIINGPGGAQQYDIVGLCMGDKAALNYLDQQHIPGSVAILGCSATGSYNTRRTLTQDWKRADLVILEYAHWQQFPNIPPVLSLAKRKLIKTIWENGVVTSWIYQ